MVSIRGREVCCIDGLLFARKGSWRIALPLFEGHSSAIAMQEKLMAVFLQSFCQRVYPNLLVKNST
jgi:hypothetical protein